jgi:hypothetical protein
MFNFANSDMFPSHLTAQISILVTSFSSAIWKRNVRVKTKELQARFEELFGQFISAKRLALRLFLERDTQSGQRKLCWQFSFLAKDGWYWNHYQKRGNSTRTIFFTQCFQRSGTKNNAIAERTEVHTVLSTWKTAQVTRVRELHR